MSLLRRAARPMLASMFVTGGLDALRNPGPKVPTAEDVASRVPGLSDQDTETLIRVNGGVQVAAGSLLALGRLPRLSALALAASLVPTTAAGHRFWEHDDPAKRTQQQIHFFKNLSMLGGLLLAALDTEGRPGLGWRARHKAEHAEAAVRRSRGQARLLAKTARAKLPG
ncbi:DoxX family protein [soil metagenome]|nr:DoxX family membrane protein [Euzebyaceae bacterium]